MKTGILIRPGLRIQRPLSSARGSDTHLVGGGPGGRPAWVLRWLRDGQALREDLLDLASVRHASLSLPTSFGRYSGRLYSLRPYVPGMDLRAACLGRRWKDVLPVLHGAAAALSILHRSGVLHGNLKASNIIVRGRGRSRWLEPVPSVVLCDPALLDERRAGAKKEIEHGTFTSDLLALGVAFHEGITGTGPRRDSAGFALPPSKSSPHVPLDLDRLVVKLLHPEPSRRYQSAEILMADLKRIARVRASGIPVPIPEVYVGRAAETGSAAALLRDFAGPALISVRGPAGIGKTAFLDRVSLEAELMGYRVARVRCYPQNPSPLAPIETLAAELGLREAGRRIRAQRLQGKIDPDPDLASRRRFLRAVLEVFASGPSTEPLLIALDDAHAADAATIDFLGILAREIGTAGEAGSRSVPALLVSYRSEGPFLGGLEPFLQPLAAMSSRKLELELGPLDPETVAGWLERAGRPDLAAVDDRMGSGGGNPFAVRQALLQADGGAEAVASPGSPFDRRYLESLGEDGARALEALAVLGRPARIEVLATLLGLTRQHLREAVGPPIADGTLADDGGRLSFRHGSLQGWIADGMAKKEKGALHHRIAALLENDPQAPAEEIAHHWFHSDEPRRGVGKAVEAARSLARSHDDRQALFFYEKLLALLPAGRGKLRREVTEEAADLLVRTGDHARGAKMIAGLMARARGLEAGRLHGRMGFYLRLQGDVRWAARHLEKGLALLRKTGKGIRHRIRMEAELAEIALVRGDHERAEKLCRGVLETVSRGRAGGAGEDAAGMEIAALEMLGRSRLRRFRYAEARELFEKSLAVKAGPELLPQRSLVHNNLGVLHNQENRFEEAIASYEEARSISLRLEQEPMLLAIDSNLAVLHVKTGAPEKADEALRRAGTCAARLDSSRMRFLHVHASGMVNLLLGRYEPAVDDFTEAVRLLEGLGDPHMLAFDLVYLAECQLHRGEARSCAEALDRAAGVTLPPRSPVPDMVASRRLLLDALRKVRPERAGASEGEPGSGMAGGPDARADVLYLDAWNRLYRGWAMRILGNRDPARRLLEDASGFFSRVKVPAGEILAQLELAALDMDMDDWRKGDRRLGALERRFPCGRGAMVSPMLSARLLAYRARLLAGSSDANPGKMRGTLLEAESFLIGRKLPDIARLVGELRRDVRSAPLAERIDLPGGEPVGTRPARGEVLVGRSPAHRILTERIRGAAASRLSVLVVGETGTGKDLVASLLHRESPRHSGPFVSIHCPALPESLLEAELFGYRAGAFSGAEKDHPGLLAAARGGTFYFDEIGDMPLAVQAKVLRVLDLGRARPLGSTEEVELDVRYVFSTHHDLRKLVREGSFRQDLFFRVAGIEIEVPPLRERVEDIELLVEHFRDSLKLEGEGPELERGALDLLRSHAWPGNVRELGNVMSRIFLASPERIGADDVSRFLATNGRKDLFPPSLLRSRPLKELMEKLEAEYLLQAHRDAGGDVRAMARALKITRRALYKRFRRLGIKPADLREKDS